MKYKKHVLKVGVDVDDVLLKCVEHAVNRCNSTGNYEPLLSMQEMTSWGVSGNRIDVVLDEFKKEDFYKTQELIVGAQEFIRKLSEQAEIYFVTAIYPEFMGIRAKQLNCYFPEVPSDHYIMTTSKNVVKLDVLLDDGGHNILSSEATYPVLLRKPWNQHITGTLAINNYDEFFVLLDEIKTSSIEHTIDTKDPLVIALVGPSGSGKTEITNYLIDNYPDLFNRTISYTTRIPRAGEIDKIDYNFINKEDFVNKKNTGEIFESTVYAGKYYGTSKNEVCNILSSGKNVIIPIDICGAMGIKSIFKNSITIYVDRKKEDLIKTILNRKIPIDEKVKRIISIEVEEKNEKICDFTIKNYSSIKDAADQVLEILN